jgi:filamentous hemagglutinin family protein
MAATKRVRRATAIAALCALAGGAQAQIRTDPSLGRGAQSLPGPNFVIPESLGSLRGANLFHSFAVFGIGAGESATFTTSTRGIANVVSRVTGGEPSTINGLLRLAAADGTPGFFFINPAGVTFGAGASIDVPGAFHVSTADYVKFADGRYYADAAASSTLSAAPPEAFGFLGTGRAPVVVNDGARLSAAVLQPFSIVAGDVTVEDATVRARGGDIRIVAVGDGRLEVGFTGALPAASGLLQVLDGGQVTAPVEGARDAGTLSVSAGDIYIDGPSGSTGLFSQAGTGTTGNAGTLDVRATGELRILGHGVISSSTFGTGNAGRIAISAGEMALAAIGLDSATGVFSTASSGSSGNAGAIDVKVDGMLLMLDGGTISTGTLSSGRAGEIHVAAGDLTISGHGIPMGIASQAQTGSSGPAGAVTVDVRGALFVEGQGQISASTFGSAAGGQVTVRAADITVFDGGKLVSSTFSSGNAGSVRVEADRITIDGNFGGSTAIVSNAQEGTGNAGSVQVTARESLTLLAGGSVLSNTFTSGNAGSISVTAGDVVIDNRGSNGGTTVIASNAYGTVGNAGAVTVDVARSLSLLDGGEISSSTFSQGNARSVTIRAGSIFMDAKEYTRFSTGIFSVAEDGSGNAGSVDIATRGDIVMLNGADILSSTRTAGAAGSVRISAANLLVDGAGNFSSISSNSNPGASGDAGTVDVEVAGSIVLRDGASIGSGTFSSGNAGAVRVRAGDITLSGGDITSQANEGTGRAGTVDVAASGELRIERNGTISSSTFSPGNAGSVTVRAGTILIDGSGGNPDIATGILSGAYEGSTGNAGSVDVASTGRTEVVQGGEISSSTFASGNAGTVRVRAGELALGGDGGLASIVSNTNSSATGNAGRVEVAVDGRLEILSGGVIASSTSSPGDAGSVSISAGSMHIDGNGMCPPCTGVFSASNEGATGRAGAIDIAVAGELSIGSNGLVNTGTRNSHDAGRINVRAQSIVIDAEFSRVDVTGILSNAIDGTGNGGLVEVAAQSITLRNGGVIGSNTYSAGSGGTVRVTANDIYLDGRDTFIASNTFRGSTGNGGTVDVRATGGVDVLNGAAISTASNGEGSAGSIVVRARDIRLDGGEFERLTGIRSEAMGFESSGNAGSIDVVATGDITLGGGGVISSDSQSYGAAGSIRVQAANIDIRGFEFQGSGIVSRAGFFSAAAGTIDVSVAGRVRVANGGRISSATDSIYGPAGSVTVTATDVLVDGINEIGWWSTIDARAGFSSTGQTGNVSVTGRRSVVVVNGGELSTTNDSLYGSPGARPTLLTVTAPLVQLANGGTITAASTGVMPASNLQIRVGERLDLDHASITTSAVEGDGGSITVSGDGVVVLRNSQITTSVSGAVGNGGDITIATRGLVMDTGFVQANPAADNAAGGNVNVNVAFLITSGNTIFVGGAQPIEFQTGVFGLNVIQAAAPTGVSGTISITTPSLDVSAGLTALSARVLDDTGLGRSLCETSGGSALAQAGRGAMPPSARGFLRAEDPDFAAVAEAGQWVPLAARITCAR